MSQLVRKIISTSSCPRPVGPYNQAIIVDRTLYLSGMVGIDPSTSQLVTGDFQAELRQTLNNIVKLLEKAGSKVDNVIKCTILLSDIAANYAMVNEEYSKGTTRFEQDIYANNIFSFPLLHPFCLSLLCSFPWTSSSADLLSSWQTTHRRCCRDRSNRTRRRCTSRDSAGGWCKVMSDRHKNVFRRVERILVQIFSYIKMHAFTSSSTSSDDLILTGILASFFYPTFAKTCVLFFYSDGLLFL